MTGGAGGLGLITGGQEDAGEGQEVSLAVPGVVTAPASLVTFLTALILLVGTLLSEPLLVRGGLTSITPTLTPTSLSGEAEQASWWLQTQETGPLMV